MKYPADAGTFLTLFFFCFSYMKLVKTNDSAEYQSSKFQHHRVDSFMFVIVTKNKYPAEDLVELTYPIRIVLPGT